MFLFQSKPDSNFIDPNPPPHAGGSPPQENSTAPSERPQPGLGATKEPSFGKEKVKVPSEGAQSGEEILLENGRLRLPQMRSQSSEEEGPKDKDLDQTETLVSVVVQGDIDWAYGLPIMADKDCFFEPDGCEEDIFASKKVTCNLKN